VKAIAMLSLCWTLLITALRFEERK